MKMSSVDIIRKVQWKVPEDIGLELQKVLDAETVSQSPAPTEPAPKEGEKLPHRIQVAMGRIANRF